MGEHTGTDLARIYASSDVFVFPSRTDTFGIVLLEALASGVPVAAYPVTGPIDVVGDGVGGACPRICARPRWRRSTSTGQPRGQKALGYGWPACAELFLKHIQRSRWRSLRSARPLAAGICRDRTSAALAAHGSGQRSRA